MIASTGILFRHSVLALLHVVSFAFAATFVESFLFSRPHHPSPPNSFGSRVGMSSDAAAASSASGPACAPAGGKCVPCESLDKSHLLSKAQIEEELKSNLKMWQMKVDATAAGAADGAIIICRKYTARNFQAALDSINAMGAIAERENHHPDFHLTGYRNVEVVLFTHSLGGISLNDIELAKMLDADVTVDYSPKWLKSHPEAKRED